MNDDLNVLINKLKTKRETKIANMKIDPLKARIKGIDDSACQEYFIRRRYWVQTNENVQLSKETGKVFKKDDQVEKAKRFFKLVLFKKQRNALLAGEGASEHSHHAAKITNQSDEIQFFNDTLLNEDQEKMKCLLRKGN
jgi:hypothetical protein